MAELHASPSVVEVDGIDDLFRTGDFYVGAQPDVDDLKWLKSQGVTLIVNLRMESENKAFAAANFDEEGAVKEQGMAYYLLPVGGQDSCCPKTVDAFAQAIKECSGNALVHCKSGGRATHLLMAYLVRHRSHTLNDAVAIGKQMMFSLMVEDFLGAPVSLTLEQAGE